MSGKDSFLADPDSLIAETQQRLLSFLRQFEKCITAYSGGVDSAVVAMAAHLALGARALAVTGVSDSLSPQERELAGELATRLGWQHREVATAEFENPNYLANSPQRCFHCKTELYSRIRLIGGEWSGAVLLNGANLDDIGDYRPGMTAAKEHGVVSPLIECQIDKRQVRQIAQAWGIPVWSKPASPCLSSRIAYGVNVTPERIGMIDQAERFLRELGLAELRVRYHAGDFARLEVPLSAISRLAEEPTRVLIVNKLKSLGFKFVTLDLEGFRTGSLNQLLPILDA